MTVRKELQVHLKELFRSRINKERDISVFLYYYGFSGSQFPTLEETAFTFGIGSPGNPRELPRQIKEKLIRKSNLRSLPKIQACIEVINRFEFENVKKVKKEFQNQGLFGKNDSILGLLRLLHDLEICLGSQIVNSDLRIVTPTSWDSTKALFLVLKSKNKLVKDYYRLGMKFPSKVGVAKLNELKSGISNNFPYYDQLTNLLESHPYAWFKQINGKHYFLFENRENAIFYKLRKIRSIGDTFNIDELSKCLANSLRGTAAPIGRSYPKQNTIREYLNESSFMEVSGAGTTILLDRLGLTKPERILKDFLEEQREPIEFLEINSYLKTHGINENTIRKVASHSPFVSKARISSNRYLYQIIGRAQGQNS